MSDGEILDLSKTFERKRRTTARRRKRAPTRRNVPDQVEADEEEVPSFGVGDPGDEVPA